MLLMRCR